MSKLERLEAVLAKKKVLRVSHVSPGYLIELECGHTMTWQEAPEQKTLYCLECQIQAARKLKGGK